MSDYEKTERRIIDNGTKVQYVAGGSRVRKDISGTPVSKVGELNPSEVYYKSPPIVTPETIKASLDSGAVKLPPGCKFNWENTIDSDVYYPTNSKPYDRNSPLLPGDKVQITADDDFKGEKVEVVSVHADFRIAGSLLTGPHVGKKVKYTKDDYVIVKHYDRGVYHIDPEDYLYHNIRDDLVKEDKS